MRNEQLRIDSGEVNSSDPLVAFLYLLIRDHIVSGDIESIMKEIENTTEDKYVFTNGFIASYAKNIKERLVD